MPDAMIILTKAEFERIRKIVYDKAGIHLPEEKLKLLSNRLRRRLRSLKLESFSDYYKLLTDAEACEEEFPHFLSAVTTNETYFFRNESLWTFFENQVIRGYARQKATKSLRIWSAASSSGEEAYTIAIIVRESLSNLDQWNVKIIASDISKRVIDKAQSGEYDAYAVSKLSPTRIRRWFTTDDKIHRLRDNIREMVTFRFHNLKDSSPEKGFDCVFVRNVLMYFDVAMKLRVLKHAIDALVPGGFLIVGDVDPIRSTPDIARHIPLEYLQPAIYRKPSMIATGSTQQGGVITK